MSENPSISWYDDFLGVAYRYFDIRMNVVLMFKESKPSRDLWYETMHWWNDHTIKIRFVETGDDYWFVMGADSRRPDTNKYFYKILEKSANYERFKKGHQGSAYMRFGIYSKKTVDEVKNANLEEYFIGVDKILLETVGAKFVVHLPLLLVDQHL